MILRISNWAFAARQDEAGLVEALARCRGFNMTTPSFLQIIKEAVDQRQKNKPRFVYTIEAHFHGDLDMASIKAKNPLWHVAEVESASEPPIVEDSGPRAGHVVVVGAGPAGFFAAYSLAMSGFRVTVLERGEDVPRRLHRVRKLFKDGVLDGESNICFGEGGAGTFSDGKLTTRKNHPWIRWILEFLVTCNAPPDILKSAKPHIGSDRLRAVLVNMRKRLVEKGVDIRFGARVCDMDLAGGVVRALRTADGAEYTGLDGVVWATGHSARDSMRLLHEKGIEMVVKPFAVGFRIEHPQELVNRWQHQEMCNGAADYSLVHNFDEQRSIYSFCMCPGGQVVCSSSHEGYHVVNGMSNYARNSVYANAGLVVKVAPGDFPNATVLAGMDFQMDIENKVFAGAGGGYLGLSQKVSDFLAGRPSSDVLESSYRPGLVPGDLGAIYPAQLTRYFAESLRLFDKKFPGFAGPQAQLIGAETRTSSPVRVQREKSGISPSARNFYPCGEGAGYAGGIMSAALDGLFIASCIRGNVKP